MKLLIGIIIILFCCKSALQAQDSLSVNAKKKLMNDILKNTQESLLPI